MKAIVLVGGLGTRLRPLTLTTPKQMLPIAGRPMIEWVIDQLAEHGVDEVILSLGYRPDAFTEAYPNAVCAGVPIRYCIEPEPRGTAGAVRYAADDAALDDTFLVLNGDVLTDLDISELIAFHKARGAAATIALHRVEDPSAYGVLPTDDNGRVLAFLEKPPRDEAPTDLINAGTYVVEPSVLDHIEPNREVSIEHVTFPALVAEESLYAMAADTYWLDTGTPELYITANLDVITGKRNRSSVDAILGTVAESASVTTSVIGAGSTVAARATVDRSVIMDDVHVGQAAVVEGSILMSGVRVGAGATITGCSVIGSGTQIAPRSHLHNERIPAP